MYGVAGKSSDSVSRARATLAARLNHLYATVHPPNRGQFSDAEVAEAIRAQGGDISPTYLWMLRRGDRTNPTMRHLEEIAAYFGVPVAYFFDDDVRSEVNRQLQRLVTLQDPSVVRVATRAAGLSKESLDTVLEVIERVRALEQQAKRGGGRD